MKNYLLVLGSGIISILIVLIFWSWISSPLVVTVTGRGEVDVPAVNAVLSFSVYGQGNDPGGAIADINGRIANLKRILKGAGVVDNTVVQSQLTVVPASSLVAGAPGYRSTASMGIINLPAIKTDAIIPVLYGGGAGLVSAPVIDSSNQTDQQQAAFKAAYKDAQKQAADIAGTNHKLIQKIIAITQQISPSTTVSGKSDTGAAQTGNNQIVSYVSVSYKMW